MAAEALTLKRNKRFSLQPCSHSPYHPVRLIARPNLRKRRPPTDRAVPTSDERVLRFRLVGTCYPYLVICVPSINPRRLSLPSAHQLVGQSIISSAPHLVPIGRLTARLSNSNLRLPGPCACHSHLTQPPKRFRRVQFGSLQLRLSPGVRILSSKQSRTHRHWLAP
jgi:hypothetical protein